MSEEIAHLAAKVGDHSSVLQALQAEMRHISKGVDRLVGVSEKQVDLGHQIQRHSDSIDRAFKEIANHRGELNLTLDKLADAITKDREAAATIAGTVTGFQAQIRALKWAWGGMFTLLSVIAAMFVGGINATQVRAEKQAETKHAEQDAVDTAQGIRIDALAMQVQEVRLDRQRDREAETP